MVNKKIVNETKFWLVSTIMLALACFVLFALNISPRITGNVVSGTTAADNVVSVASAQFDSVEVLSVNEKSGLYEIELLLDGEEYPVYVTKDGLYLVNGLVEITEPEQNLEIDNEAIAEFVDCLAEKEFKIYGANWCGWTKKLVDSFGGQSNVGLIYVECTEDEELCAQEIPEGGGYPTIKINGELYQSERTFEAFAEATGCLAPEEVSVSSDDTGSC